MRAWLLAIAIVSCGGRAVVPHAAPDADLVVDAPLEVDDADPDADTGVAIQRTITKLIGGQQDPCALAVDSKSVYWTACASHTLAKIPRQGGKATILSSGGSPGGIAVDAKEVYWTSANALLACPLDGCSTERSVGGDTPTGVLALDALDVYYFASYYPQVLLRCTKSGCFGTKTQLATNASPAAGMVVRGGFVYWTERVAGAIKKCPTAGCTAPAIVASAPSYPTGIAADDVNVYWTNQSPDGSVMKCPLGGGGSPTVLASAQSYPTGIATDGANVYWTNQEGGAVMKCSVDGCDGKPETIAADQLYPTAIAVDGDSVFWIDVGPNAYDGAVMKATPK